MKTFKQFNEERDSLMNDFEDHLATMRDKQGHNSINHPAIRKHIKTFYQHHSANNIRGMKSVLDKVRFPEKKK